MSVGNSTRRRWTSEEGRKLEELLKAGKEAAKIAVILNRSRHAIYARLQRTYRKRSGLSGLARPGLKGETK